MHCCLRLVLLLADPTLCLGLVVPGESHCASYIRKSWTILQINLPLCSSAAVVSAIRQKKTCQFLCEMCFVTTGCSCCRMNWAQCSRCGLPSAEGLTLLAQGQLVGQDTRPFFAKLFPRCRTWHFPLLNAVNFLLACFSSLPRSPQMAAQPSGVPAAPPSPALSAGLQQTCRGCSLSCHLGC